jgi:hypothetical protein
MNSGLVFQLFSSWKIIFVCACIMFLLPLIFYLASLKPARRRLPPLKLGKSKKARPAPAASKATEERGRGERHREEKREEEKEEDETEYRERK